MHENWSDGDRSVRDSWNRMIILMFSLNLNYEPAKTLISHVLSAIRSGPRLFEVKPQLKTNGLHSFYVAIMIILGNFHIRQPLSTLKID